MTTMEIFMNLARRHTENHMVLAGTHSDIHEGFALGLEASMETLAKLPELAGDCAVQAVLDRLAHGMAAFPIKNGDGRQWWEDATAFQTLCGIRDEVA